MWEVLDVALHVELGLLLVRRLAEGDDPITLLVHVARHAPDRAALAGGVAPVEEDDDLPLVGLEVLLELDQLRLVGLEVLLGEVALQGALDDALGLALAQLPASRACSLLRSVQREAIENPRDGVADSVRAAGGRLCSRGSGNLFSWRRHIEAQTLILWRMSERQTIPMGGLAPTGPRELRRSHLHSDSEEQTCYGPVSSGGSTSSLRLVGTKRITRPRLLHRSRFFCLGPQPRCQDRSFE